MNGKYVAWWVEAFPRHIHREYFRSLTRWSLYLLALSGLLIVCTITSVTQKALAADQGSILNVVAHEDDDLLFLSPDLLNSIQAGEKVRTIYLTAGDAGQPASYWQDRELGVKAAYAEMAGVPNSWNQADAGIPGHPMPLYTLAAQPAVSLLFMRLPDGNLDGSGFPSTNYQSLQKLWTGSISTIDAVNGSSSYTKSSLISTLTNLINDFQPTKIRTQDYTGSYSNGDHSDHYSVAYFIREAQRQYTTPHTFSGYYGYNDVNLPANVSGTDLAGKQSAFYAYASYDPGVCSSQSGCAGTSYEAWLTRQYTLSTAYPPVADAGPGQLVAVGSPVQLDGTGSTDPDGDPLTYQWTQTAGTPVTLSSPAAARPSFTAPAAPAALTFQLVVSDGQAASAPATVTVTVAVNPDLALAATAAASSASPGQGPAKAIDGVADGYPRDPSREWATSGGTAGSWLTLTWPAPQTLNTLVLYDRPNLSDQITAATVTFSDGTALTLTALPDDGSPYTLAFPPRTVTSLRLDITAVSPATQNAGLAEIQAYNTGGAS